MDFNAEIKQIIFQGKVKQMHPTSSLYINNIIQIADRVKTLGVIFSENM